MQKPNKPNLNKTNTFYPLPETGECPKCSNVRFESQLECFSCGLVFEKFEKIQIENRFKEKIGGIDHLSFLEIKRLESIWKSLVTQYPNVIAHDQFLRDCMQVGALPFASWSYRNMLKLDREDLIALTQIEKTKALMSYPLESFSPNQGKVTLAKPYLKWIERAGLILSTFLLVFGLLVSEVRLWGLCGAFMLISFLALSSYRKKNFN